MRGFLHCGKKMSIVQETVRCRAHCLFILIKKICVPCGNAGTDRLDFFHRSRKKGKKQALIFLHLAIYNIFYKYTRRIHRGSERWRWHEQL